MKHNINVIIEDYIQQLLTCESKEDVTKTLQAAASFLGFDYFAYGIKTKLPITSPRVEMLNSYSDKWNDQYINKGLALQDPLISLGMQRSHFIIWDNVIDESAHFWQQAKLHGIHAGWSKSTHFPGGAASLLSFSRGESDTPIKEINANMPYLLWIASIADSCMEKVLDINTTPSPSTHLTPREIEVLKWTADGKTMSEIGIILNVSDRTAEFHLANAAKKLGAPNKTSAAVRAALLGLI
ncbi:MULTISPECIES: autoinducer binding domain-containing protein [Vibrio]|uniref:autoinducer binding domain-containing protein n=1 Tax=Vibrio TaxID=662 RepID=UPI001E46C333|nr:autoinducer binding domain-containing protein [Vibrio lentus]MCC4838063.1 autoinducer binding domain-containing protein [Vibrio lentus]